MDRKDTIAFNAGEAVQTNVVTLVPDPWPAHARQKDLAFSGERMARAVRCYELGPKAPSGGGGGVGNVTVNLNTSANASGGAASAQATGTATQC